jgi:hypothetical protein
VDGVCAQFNHGYIAWLRTHTGEDRFLPEDLHNPPVWDYPEHRGYSTSAIQAFWAHVRTAPSFWRDLPPTPDFEATQERLQTLSREHLLVFITARSGQDAASQTLAWLQAHGIESAVVKATSDKAPWAAAFGLHSFLDDYLGNALALAKALPAGQSFLLDRAYNQHPPTSYPTPAYRRVRTLHEYLDALGV